MSCACTIIFAICAASLTSTTSAQEEEPASPSAEVGGTAEEAPPPPEVEAPIVNEAGLTDTATRTDAPAIADGPQELTIVGSRVIRPRTVIASPVAVDVIDAREAATDSGNLDLNRLLHVVAPSFNATRQSGADGADHIDPATLRGLGPDQTLVLINGKRRHQSSLINIFGTRGRGNTGTDLNAIPIAAIERIEILRDGASAIYGSDAIAGVINIVLRKDVGALDVWLSSGLHNAKPPGQYDVVRGDSFDGETVGANANYGMRIGEKGFANFTLDYNKVGHTNRPANPDKFSVYRKQFGDAAVDDFAVWMNSEVPLNKLELYVFGGGSLRDTDAYAWTREADSERNVLSIYPNGFDPRITSKILDLSVSAGVRASAGDWNVDINNTFGRNRFHYLIDDTLNASLLDKSPTRFDAGGHQFTQNVTGVHLNRALAFEPIYLYLALGSEFRVDNFEIFAGEEASYRNYGLEQQVVNGQVMTVDTLMRPGGSQGFPGYTPENAVDETRTNLAVYAETEADLTQAFLVDVAARFERYSDFGNTVNAKASARYEFAELIGASLIKHAVLRASVSTGFRAPSLAQIYYNTKFTDFVGGVPVDKLIAKNDSPVTHVLGIPPLTEEKSVNGSAGLTIDIGDLQFSADGYIVDIKDRIVLTGAFANDDPDIGATLTALNVGAAQFFANALDTQTFGLDLVLDAKRNISDRMRLRAQVGANINHMKLGELRVATKLIGKEDTFFGEREQRFLLASAPKSKVTLMVGFDWGPFFSNLLFTRYDRVRFIDWVDTPDIYDPKITTDLNLGFKITDSLTLIAGGVNLFNVYPTQQDTETESGGIWDSVQMGYSGAFYYAKLNARL